jgi:hypothetical protein
VAGTRKAGTAAEVIMDPEAHSRIKAAHKAASLIGISIIVSLMVTLAASEAIRAWLRPFRGFVDLRDPQRVRYAFFAAAILAVVLVRVLRRSLPRRTGAPGAGPDLRRIQRSAILTVVLCEVPALLGLVLFLVGGFNIDFYLLLFVSLVLIFIYFPRLSHWRDMMGD